MQLEKHPETEMEYWAVIEGLGGMAWGLNHDLADGRISDPKGEADQTISSMRDLQEQLVSEIVQKFGVIHPKDCPRREPGKKLPRPPKGKKYYWPWYNRMKTLYHRIEYEKMICSACPFTRGVSHMIRMGNVPCGLINGYMTCLSLPHRCGMLGFREWTEDRLLKEIMRKGGEVALTRFRIKEAGLKALTKPETRQVEVPR